MQSKRDEREAGVAEAVEDIRLATEDLEIYAEIYMVDQNIFIQSIVNEGPKETV